MSRQGSNVGSRAGGSTFRAASTREELLTAGHWRWDGRVVAFPPPKAVLELRVHGVHATPPASILGVEPGEVVQVAGDSLTGVYRAKPKVDLPDRDTTDVDIEAYSWGALTSGVKGMFGWISRALWLLLLPFAMANLAYWARLELGRDSGTARWGARAVRVSALFLTVFLVLTSCVVAIDMVAWQCFRGASPGCSRLPGVLDFLIGMPAPRRMAMASAVPVLLLLVLWFLSRQSLTRYEDVTVPDEDMSGDGVAILRHPAMWRGLKRTQMLQRLHLTLGMGTVVCFSGVHLLSLREEPAQPNWPFAWIFVNVCLTIILAAIAITQACAVHEDDVEFRDEAAGRLLFHDRTADIVALTQVVVLASHLLSMAGPAFENLPQTGQFAGHNVWFIAVFVILTALHVSVFVGGRMSPQRAVAVVAFVAVLGSLAVWGHWQGSIGKWTTIGALAVVGVLWLLLTRWHYRVADPRLSVAWRGAGASVMLASAAWISLLFTSAIAIAGANYLNGPDPVSDLVSELPRKTLTSEEASTKKTWTASGPVTVSDAVLKVDGDQVTVTSGDIEVNELSQSSGRVLLGGGIFRQGDEGEVRLTDTRVLIHHSCVVDVQDLSETTDTTVKEALGEASIGRCSAEIGTFVNAGALPISDRMLTVDADRDRVLLEVANPQQMPLVVPQVLIWTPIFQGAWVVLVLGGLLACFLRFGKRVKPGIAGLNDSWVAPRYLDAVVRRRTSAAFAHRAETLLDVVGFVTAPVGLALIVLSSAGRAPWRTDVASWTRHLATPSMYLVLAMSAGLLLVASRLRTSEKARQAVGVIWDLTTFWPRAAHPLAPPCYAERVVPDLRTRVDWALKRSAPDGLVILSGHSQGSLIVTAVAARLKPEDLRRIRIITYGSQVRALYGRMFPRVAGPGPIGYRPSTPTTLSNPFPDVPVTNQVAHTPPDHSLLHDLRERGGEWVNLFRRTDPLGFRVFGDVDGDGDLVTPEVPPEADGDPGPEVMTHSDYQLTPTYIEAVDAWVPDRR